MFFDIDNTLFPTSEFAELARKNAVRSMIELGLPFTDSDLVYTKLLAIIKKQGSNDQHHFDALLKELNVEKPAKYIAAAVGAYHNTKTTILPYPDVPLMLLTLREKGYKLYIATNGNAIKQWDKLIRLGIALYFEDVFVSDEIGVEKSEKFFTTVLKQLNISPQSCVMIGDKDEFDIVPAKKVGMNVVKVDRNSTEKKQEPVIPHFSTLLEILKKL